MRRKARMASVDKASPLRGLLQRWPIPTNNDERALKKLIGDAALRRSMGEQSRLLAETEFGQETVIAQTLAVYREVCA